MYQKIDFNQLGGAPFDQQTLEFMQDAYLGFADCLAGFVGDNVIVAGCVASGNSVSAGWVIVKGELLPFAKSETGVLDTFIIRETATPLIFESGESKNVEFKRIAMFGSNANAFKWGDLTRLPTLKGLSDSIDKHTKDILNPHKVTKAQIGLSNIPNAKTDDANVNNSNILATSAMVHNAISLANGVKMSGKFEIDKTTGITNFAIPKLNPTDYQIIAQIVSEGDFFGRGKGIRTVEKAMTYVFLVDNPNDRPDNTLITAIYDVSVLPVNDILFCYFSIISL